MHLMINELHLPWTNDKLEELLRQIIKTGETTKVDFKAMLDLTSMQGQAEMLKDVSAIANTYDYPYKNHGFIIIGVSSNKITYNEFKQNADALQASIDDLVRHYLDPFVSTHVRIFEENEQKWGVIVIPPTHTAPHVFTKDIHKRYRGDVYVRRGTITEKAQSGDYIRFFRMHIDEQTFSFQQQVKEVQQDILEINKRLDSERIIPTELPKENPESKTPSKNTRKIRYSSRINLIQEIQKTLASEIDPIAQGLAEEAKKINDFLDSNEVSWALQVQDKKTGEEVIDKIEKVSDVFWHALSTLIEKDDKGEYEDTIIQTITYLARFAEAPTGVSYTSLGRHIRYYPLVVSLYILFIIGTFKKKNTLLRKIKEIPLIQRSIYDEPSSIVYTLFHIRSSEEVFQTKRPDYPNRKWCDSVGTYIKEFLQGKIKINHPTWDFQTYFYIGEFLLCLTPIDLPEISRPSSGAFLYFNESEPIIKRFLSTNVDWAAKIYSRPFVDILSNFDENASKFGRGGCFASGFSSGAVQMAYPKKGK